LIRNPIREPDRLDGNARARPPRAVLSLALTVLVGALVGVVGCHEEQTRVSLETPSEKDLYLDYALRAEGWLRQQARQADQGRIWRSADEATDHPVTNGNLYYGSSGVILFYLELYHQTGDVIYLREAEAGGRYLLAAVPDELYFAKSLNALELYPSLNQPGEGGLPVYTAANGLGHPNQASLYWGVSGIGFTLGELFRVTRDETYRRGATRIVDLLLQNHHADEHGASWGSTPELMTGDAGVGLFLLYASRELEHPGAEALARAIGDSLLAKAKASGEGLMWPTRAVYGTDYPNFSHGTAGVGYYLTTLHEHTGEKRYLKGARRVGHYLRGLADETGLIGHHQPDPEGLVYYGWCHGPPGTNRFFGKLSSADPAPAWSSQIERSTRAVLEADLLGREPAGFWQNVGQCCGSAGIAHYYLGQYLRTKKPAYLEFAELMTRDIIRHATLSGEVASWNHAEHRSTPEFTQTLTGYMQGAAGIGMHLLRMHALLNDRSISIWLLDDRD